MALRHWPGYLQEAQRLGFFPYGVSVLNGFPNNTLGRPMPDNLNEYYWHHDATPQGPTPGGLSWLINAYNAKSPSAQNWTAYDGRWNFVGGGYASHAGVTDGASDSSDSVGNETDHTTGEAMSPALLDSMQRGYAVILVKEGKPASTVVFHKYRGFPYGRKPDPWFPGDDDVRGSRRLAEQRAIIARRMDEYRAILAGGVPVQQPTQEEDDMPYTEGQLRAIIRSELDASEQDNRNNLIEVLRAPEFKASAPLKVVRQETTGIDYAYGPGYFKLIESPDDYHFLASTGLINTPHGTATVVADNLLGYIRERALEGTDNPAAVDAIAEPPKG